MNARGGTLGEDPAEALGFNCKRLATVVDMSAET